MNSKWIENSCNGCGECCIRNSAIDIIDEEEWPTILRFLNENYNGELYVMNFNPDIKRYIRIPFKPILDDFSRDNPSDLFWILNNEDNPCPFLKFDLNAASYSCTIQVLKPGICQKWYCEPQKFRDSEFNICVLGYGQEMEYPTCKQCQKKDSDEDPSNQKDGTPQCESGEGCISIEKRVRYFLRYAKTHEKTNEVIEFAKKLKHILEKQNIKFQNFLERELDKLDIEFLLNVNNYTEFIKALDILLNHHNQ